MRYHWTVHSTIHAAAMYFALAGVREASGQASLKGGDQTSIVVNVNEGQGQEVLESFTVIRDATNSSQFYYVFDQPRLVERTRADGTSVPEFSLITYQFRNPNNLNAILEGGILQFAVTLDLAPIVIDRLKKKLAETMNMNGDEDLKLAPLPMKSAKVILYTPGGDLMPTNVFGSGSAPTFASQKMVFSIDLTQIGADVYKALTTGNTGIPVAIEFDYAGVTPASNFEVVVNWDEVRKFYARNEKFRASAGWWGFGASAKADRNRIVDQLKTAKCIEIRQTRGEEGNELADKLLEVVLVRIGEEMGERLEPPEKIEPPKAPKPGGGGWFGGVGYSAAIEKREVARKGTETISFQSSQIVNQTTYMSGFIGVGGYSDEVKSKLFGFVPAGQWSKVYVMVPTIFADKKYHVDDAMLNIQLKQDGNTLSNHTLKWDKDDQVWTLRDTAISTTLGFLQPLQEFVGNGDNPNNLQFETELKLMQDGLDFGVTARGPVFEADRAIWNLPAVTKVIGIDASGLKWNLDDREDAGLVESLEVKLNYSDNGVKKRWSKMIKPWYENNQRQRPGEIAWLVPKNAEVAAELTATMSDGNQQILSLKADELDSTTVITDKMFVLKP